MHFWPWLRPERGTLVPMVFTPRTVATSAKCSSGPAAGSLVAVAACGSLRSMLRTGGFSRLDTRARDEVRRCSPTPL